MTKFSNPPNQSKGILDDYAVRKDINTREGSICHVPTEEDHITNKKYVDSLIRGNVELFFTEDASDIGTYFDLATDSTGNPEETTTQAITANSTTLIAAYASILNEAEIEAITDLEGGIYSMHVHASANFPANMTLYFEFYRRTAGGAETLLGTSHDSDTLAAAEAQYEVHANISTDLIWDTGDRVVVKVYGRNGNAAAKDITINVEGDTLSRVSFPAFIPPTFVAPHKVTHITGGSDIVEALPIGFVFISVVADNPNTLLGYGTWSAIGAGRVLVGLDAGDADFDTIEETGGSKTHTLTIGELATHDHGVTTIQFNDASHTHTSGTYAVNGTHTHTDGSFSVSIDHDHPSTAVTGTSATDTHSHNRDSTGYVEFYAAQVPGGGTSIATATQPDSILTFATVTGTDIHSHSRGTYAVNIPNYNVANRNVTGTSAAGGNNVDIDGTSAAGSAHNHSVSVDVLNTGSDTAHNNVQPYLVVHMWKRTA